MSRGVSDENSLHSLSLGERIEGSRRDLSCVTPMPKKVPQSIIPVEQIASRIYIIRRQKVMLDRDLAELYGVPTGRLNEQVRRNINRSPSDFMFPLSKKEIENWKSQIAASNSSAS